MNKVYFHTNRQISIQEDKQKVPKRYRLFHHSNQGELYYLSRFQSVEEHMVTIVKPKYIFIVICLFVIMNEAKKARTIAKSSFTRSAKSIQRLIEQGRPEPEVVKAGGIFETAYERVLSKHEGFAILVEEKDYEQEEEWMEDVSKDYDAICIMINDYKITMAPKNNITTDKVENPASSQDVDVDPNNTNISSGSGIDETAESVPPGETEPTVTLESSPDNQAATTNLPTYVTPSPSPNSMKLRTERAPLPKFDGNVRNYLDFRRDFKFLVEKQYTTQEALYVLRSCLDKSSADLIKCKEEYDAAWEKLDREYGDPRIVSDVLLSDLEKVKPVDEFDYAHFVQYHALIEKIFSMLTKLNRPGDLDNTPTLSAMEKKLSRNDRLKWADYQEEKGVTPKIENFLKWMEKEVRKRKIAGADIRSQRTISRSADNKGSVNIITLKGEKGTSTGTSMDKLDSRTENPREVLGEGNQSPPQPPPQPPSPPQPPPQPTFQHCWLCKQPHQLDTCQRFLSMTPTVRLTEVRKAHACYFCLKIHRNPCRRKKKCTLLRDGEACKFSHHPLLHGAPFERMSNNNVSVIAGGESLLPTLEVSAINSISKQKAKANILFDGGSQLTLIREQFAENLGLHGESIGVRISKVGGTEELLQSKTYTLQIRSLDGGPKFALKAVAIPLISENVRAVRIKKYAKLFKIDAKRLHRVLEQ